MPTIPWEADVTVSFAHERVSHKITPSPSDCVYDDIEARLPSSRTMGIVSWTNHQWLDIGTPPVPAFKAYGWSPYGLLSAYKAIAKSRFYADSQVQLLASCFDPPEWAEKGGIVDEQAYFDDICPQQVRVYSGYCGQYMSRLSQWLVEKGLLHIEKVFVDDVNTVEVVGCADGCDSSRMTDWFREFLETELSVAVYFIASAEDVEQFHRQLPDDIREWIELRQDGE